MGGINPKAVAGRQKRQSQFTPVGVLNEIHDGMAEGARKYGPYNWRDVPIEVSDYYDSLNRHMSAWWEGEDIDPDSGVNHISKAITGLIVLRDAMLHGTAVDDRPCTPKTERCDTCGEVTGHRDICPKSDLEIHMNQPPAFSVSLVDHMGSVTSNINSNDVRFLDTDYRIVAYKFMKYAKRDDGRYHETYPKMSKLKCCLVPAGDDHAEHCILRKSK